MLTKNKIQFIKNLHEKSGRHEAGLFLVEGRKGIMEFLDSDFEVVEGYFTDKFFFTLSFRRETEESLSNSSYENKVNTFSKAKEKGMPTAGQKIPFPYEIISEKELERISTLSSNRDGLLVVKMKSHFCHPDGGRICPEGMVKNEQIPRTSEGQKNLTLILDGINDPGNLGTIIRIADWYGVSHIIASTDTVDCYNPKVIMATMGSFTRVHLEYRDLEEYLVSVIPGLTRNPAGNKDSLGVAGFLPSQEGQMPIYGAYLEGESIRTKKFTPVGGYLVIGSESHGIRPHLEQYITDKITIPRTGLAESLNAGVATAVILERMAIE